jgi:hypothetical protein
VADERFTGRRFRRGDVGELKNLGTAQAVDAYRVHATW